jgi:uncharacterized protein YdaU (DUF1376 family)
MAASKTNDFYIRFNTSDFLAATMWLTPQQLGIYIKLYAMYWSAKRVLPGDLATLSRNALLAPEHQADLKVVLETFFMLNEDGNTYRHPQLDEIASENQQKRDQDAKNGREGAAVKKAKKEGLQQAALLEQGGEF